MHHQEMAEEMKKDKKGSTCENSSQGTCKVYISEGAYPCVIGHELKGLSTVFFIIFQHCLILCLDGDERELNSIQNLNECINHNIFLVCESPIPTILNLIGHWYCTSTILVILHTIVFHVFFFYQVMNEMTGSKTSNAPKMFCTVE